MHVTARIFLLRMIHERMHIAFQRPIAAGRVGVEPTARLHCDIGGLLHRRDGEIAGRLQDDSALATDPGNNRRPVFVIMAPTGLAFLAAPTRAAPQGLLPTLLSLPLVAGGLVEVIRFHRAFELAVHLVGQGRIAEPPAPAVAGPAMEAQLAGDAPGRAGETQQKSGENPGRQRSLAPMQQGIGEVVEGALATMAPVAFASGSILVGAPLSNVVALASRT